MNFMNSPLISQTSFKKCNIINNILYRKPKECHETYRDTKIQVVILKNVINIMYYIQKEQNPLYKFQKAFCDS